MKCRVCAAEVPEGAPRCPNCSAAAGPQDPCPHCRAQAGASPHAELRAVCDVCGGPRVPRLDRAIRYAGRELPLLRRAEKARKARAGWRAAAIASGLLLPLVLLFFAALSAIFGFGFGLLLATLACVLPVGGFFAYAILQAGARGREIGPALDAAWLAVATDVAAQTRGLTAPTLAQKLGIEEPQAEELMALLDVNDALGGSPRVRVGPSLGPRSGAIAVQPTEIAAEEEAAAVEQDQAEQKGRL
jgi:hypothetical protein